MSEEKTFETLPPTFQEALRYLVADTYGEEHKDATDAWLAWEASVLHDFDMAPPPDENDKTTWSFELIAFVRGWLAATAK